MRSAREIGNLWPRCTTCGHIAQEHDFDMSCKAAIRSQCLTCGTHSVLIKCPCKEYKGMTRKEWFALLTAEEIAHYRYSL